MLSAHRKLVDQTKDKFIELVLAEFAKNPRKLLIV